jgi:ubiquitin carboxyl-terminal hydrolase 4/11/15
VSRCDSGQKAVTRNAYLLFYRRRTPTPLGPPNLQKIVLAAESDAPADSDAEDTDEPDRSRPRDSFSGNGQRLDASSRNGSSSAFTAGTAAAVGAGALRGGGSLPLSGRASLLKNGVGAASLSDEEVDDALPMTDGTHDETDEGFVDADDNVSYGAFNGYDNEQGPVWSFDGLGHSSTQRNHNDSDDDVASDAPNLGSEDGAGALDNRLLEDFGDDVLGHPGSSTPVEGIQPSLGGERGDGDVHEIRVLGE